MSGPMRAVTTSSGTEDLHRCAEQEHREHERLAEHQLAHQGPTTNIHRTPEPTRARSETPKAIP